MEVFLSQWGKTGFAQMLKINDASVTFPLPLFPRASVLLPPSLPCSLPPFLLPSFLSSFFFGPFLTLAPVSYFQNNQLTAHYQGYTRPCLYYNSKKIGWLQYCFLWEIYKKNLYVRSINFFAKGPWVKPIGAVSGHVSDRVIQDSACGETYIIEFLFHRNIQRVHWIRGQSSKPYLDLGFSGV